MLGMRCVECGESRWSLLGRVQKENRCPNCGMVMVEERRRPGARRTAGVTLPVERRDAPPSLSR
jgi:DNA-directed RNA polymerase subunit RPC12/RpoP